MHTFFEADYIDWLSFYSHFIWSILPTYPFQRDVIGLLNRHNHHFTPMIHLKQWLQVQ